MMTSERIQYLSGIPVDVAELMMVLWMASIVVLKSFRMSVDFFRLVSVDFLAPKVLLGWGGASIFAPVFETRRHVLY